MNNLWLKIKLWTKVVLFGAIGLYAILFVALNWNVRIQGDLNFMFVQFPQPKVLPVMLLTAVVSIIGWWLIRTVVKTVRQFNEARDRARTGRLEKELAEMKAKAASLQVRDGPAASAVTQTFRPEDEE